MRFALLCLALLLPVAAGAQTLTSAQREEVVAVVRDALKKDPSILRDALVALQADEARRQEKMSSDAIGQLLPQLVTAADPVIGNPGGNVTVIEFYDTRCPYCRRMLPTLTDLVRQDPKVRVVFKDWPILGPASELESRALLAAQRQGRYVELQAALMGSSTPPTRDLIRAEADKLGLDGTRLLRDMDDPAIKTRLDANLAMAQRIGLQGTPAIIIGQRLFGGMMEPADLRQAVAEARAGKTE